MTKNEGCIAQEQALFQQPPPVFCPLSKASVSGAGSSAGRWHLSPVWDPPGSHSAVFISPSFVWVNRYSVFCESTTGKCSTLSKQGLKILSFDRLSFEANVFLVVLIWAYFHVLLERVVCILWMNMRVHLCIYICIIWQVGLYNTVIKKNSKLMLFKQPWYLVSISPTGPL